MNNNIRMKTKGKFLTKQYFYSICSGHSMDEKDWETEFDRLFGYTDTQYEPPQRRMNHVEVYGVLDFIHKEETEATQRGREEVLKEAGQKIKSMSGRYDQRAIDEAIRLLKSIKQ